jgi:hypothetical protein
MPAPTAPIVERRFPGAEFHRLAVDAKVELRAALDALGPLQGPGGLQDSAEPAEGATVVSGACARSRAQ